MVPSGENQMPETASDIVAAPNLPGVISGKKTKLALCSSYFASCFNICKFGSEHIFFDRQHKRKNESAKIG
jgi:hypothetical protein